MPALGGENYNQSPCIASHLECLPNVKEKEISVCCYAITCQPENTLMQLMAALLQLEGPMIKAYDRQHILKLSIKDSKASSCQTIQRS
ncbi:hypothetical protein T03_7463 [Trichinella britovi]|uniref:Uncharacterized protein n=1 Tax=Trichinella britovi TaxID=45882 RepID=A0A0V1DJA8_TRIBR|nr:hypothetical protein T03_7463 [Trichinella britovi]